MLHLCAGMCLQRLLFIKIALAPLECVHMTVTIVNIFQLFFLGCACALLSTGPVLNITNIGFRVTVTGMVCCFHYC